MNKASLLILVAAFTFNLARAQKPNILNMNRFKNILLLLGIMIGFFSCQITQNKEDKKPNILIIVADDLGWNDVSLHGSAIKTPAIDKLAEEVQKNKILSDE